MANPLILMTDPKWFDVSYEINPWMRPTVWGADAARHAKAARKAFDALVAALRGAGAAIEIIDGATGLPDMVFTANAAVVLDGRVLVARFRPAERQGEEARYLAAFNTLKTRGLVDDVAQDQPAANVPGEERRRCDLGRPPRPLLDQLRPALRPARPTTRSPPSSAAKVAPASNWPTRASTTSTPVSVRSPAAKYSTSRPPSRRPPSPKSSHASQPRPAA